MRTNPIEVLDVVGDGGLAMMMAELTTAVQLDLSLKIVVLKKFAGSTAETARGYSARGNNPVICCRYAGERGETPLRRALFAKVAVTLRMAAPKPGPSRRAVLRGLASAASTLALGGCASLASTGVNTDASELSVHPSLVVATTRKPVKGGWEKPWFGPERGSTVTIALAKLAPPDEGQFSLSAVGLGDWRIDGVEPAPQLGELLAQEGSGRDVLIYVHGYNQTFEMAAIDAARLSHGARFRGETMMFSWPSKAKLLDYGYDRESAMWSRDVLERVLDDVMNGPCG